MKDCRAEHVPLSGQSLVPVCSARCACVCVCVCRTVQCLQPLLEVNNENNSMPPHTVLL